MIQRAIGRRRARPAEDDRGAVAILVAVLIPVLVLLTALAVDVGRWYVEAARVQKAADAAALGGVTYMPNNFGDSSSTSGTAQATARSISSVNGFPNSGSSSVAVFNPSGYPTQLGVTVSSTVNNLFGKIFGRPTTTIARTAVADYAAPTIMGSPCNALGNQPVSTLGAALPNGTVIQTSSTLCSNNPGYWLRMAGPATSKSMGDRYATTGCGSTPTGNDPYCVSNVNTEYTPTGYLFTIRVTQAAIDANGGSLTLYPQVYDPAYIDTGSTCSSGPNPSVSISSWSRSGTTVTVNTSSAHGLKAGDQVEISGIGTTGISGRFTVLLAPTTSRFTYSSPNSGNASGSSGTAWVLVNGTNPFVPNSGINTGTNYKAQDRYENSLALASGADNPYCSGDNNPGGTGTEGFVTSFIVRGTTTSNNPLDALPIANCTSQFKPQAAGISAAALTASNTANYKTSIAQEYHQWVDLCATTAGVATGFTVSSPGDYYIQVRTNLNAASSGMTNVNPDGLILKPTDGGGTSSNPIAYPTASLLNVGTMGHNIFAMRIATSTSGPTSAGDDVSLSAQNRLPIYANQVGAQNVNLIQVPENARGSTFDFSFFDVTDYSGNATLRVLGPGDVAWSGCSIAGGLTGTFNASTCTITMPGGTNNNQGRTGTMTVPIPTGYECTSFGTPAPRECWFRVAFTIGSGANEDTTWSANLNGDPVRLVQ